MLDYFRQSRVRNQGLRENLCWSPGFSLLLRQSSLKAVLQHCVAGTGAEPPARRSPGAWSE